MEKICKISSDHISLVSNSGWFDEFTSTIFNNDPLVQAVALQHITDFIESEVTIDKFSNAGLFTKIEKSLQDSLGHSKGLTDMESAR